MMKFIDGFWQIWSYKIQILRSYTLDTAVLPLSLIFCQQAFCIPQRPYAQGSVIPPHAVLQYISFATTYGFDFPAEVALAGKCDSLVDGDTAVFAEQVQTINLRIEVFYLFPPSTYLSSNSHATVAGLPGMGSAGEHLVSLTDRLIQIAS